MNFVAVVNSKSLPHPAPLQAGVQSLAVHHQRARHPMLRHAYRLSQVITYGVALPQVFVN